MQKLCNFIVDKRKIFFVVFLVLSVVCAGLTTLVKVNYNLSDYLPDDSETKVAMEVLYDEFGDNGTLTVMASDLSLKESLEFKNQIAGVENVESVLWLDTALGEYLTQYKTIIGIMWPQTKDMDEEQMLDFMLGLLDSDSESAEDGEPSIPAAIRPMMEQMVEPFYKDGKALFQVTFTGTAYDESTVAAIDRIKGLGVETNLGGASASSYAMQKALIKELLLAAAIIIPLLLLLLLLLFGATSSYFDPVIYLVVIGASVLLNMGTNFFLGSISYLTNSIAALIQVAVSMDYSIFLLHSYKQQRKSGLSPEDSAKTALRKSMSPVSASSLTTIAGFVALMFMRYQLGLDIGLVLTKGIVFSLLSAFLFMPALLVMCDKVMTRGEHRTLLAVLRREPKPAAGTPVQPGSAQTELLAGCESEQDDQLSKDGETPQKPQDQDRKGGETSHKPRFSDRFAGGLLKLRYVLPVVFLVLMIPSYFLQSQNNFMYGELASAGGEGSMLVNDRIAIEETFGSQNNLVVLISREYEDQELSLTQKLSELDFVSSAQSYSLVADMANGTVPSYMDAQFRSENYTRIILVIDTEEESEEAFAAVETVRAAVAEELSGGYYLMGSTVSTQELKTVNQTDYTRSTTLAMIFIFLILLVSTRSLVLPLLLAVLIQGSIWINMAIPALANMTIVFLGYLFVSCFQMGCTIDYGILLSTNYTNYRQTLNKFDAAKAAFKSSIGAISLSASILTMVGFAVGLVGSIPATSNIGLLLGLGTIVSYLTMTFVLPLLLVLFDKPIRATTLRRKRRRTDGETSSVQPEEHE